MFSRRQAAKAGLDRRRLSAKLMQTNRIGIVPARSLHSAGILGKGKGNKQLHLGKKTALRQHYLPFRFNSRHNARLRGGIRD